MQAHLPALSQPLSCHRGILLSIGRWVSADHPLGFASQLPVRVTMRRCQQDAQRQEEEWLLACHPHGQGLVVAMAARGGGTPEATVRWGWWPVLWAQWSEAAPLLGTRSWLLPGLWQQVHTGSHAGTSIPFPEPGQSLCLPHPASSLFVPCRHFNFMTSNFMSDPCLSRGQRSA